MRVARPPGTTRRWAPRSWELWSLPKDLIRYLIFAELAALLWMTAALLTETVNRSELIRFAVLTALVIAFQQISPRIERMRIRLADSHSIDMTSVWTFAGVIALPAGLAALLGVFGAVSMSTLRLRAGVHPYRQLFTAATVVLACLTGTTIVHLSAGPLGHLTGGAAAAGFVLLAMVLYTAVNTSMIAGAIFLSARPLPVRALFGTAEENGLEVATLCLGAMTGLTVVYTPWLTVLSVVPLVALQRGALIKQLEVAATTDPKTGLLNAVAWRQVAQKEVARAARDRHTVAVLIIDMDRFKEVNDTYGHLVGDAVLISVAERLTTELRQYDSIGRFGGEEFVAILPEVDLATARAISDRILSRIRELEVFSPNAPEVPVRGFSASIGLALYPNNGADIEGLMHVADSALYAAKSAGRDRVECIIR
ncbi:GGDEF domain-containing protein [Jatrophihabitans sp.]|uniref:GGDEF domain-containing protein n=1 Tax=Jatrophihabitans sp. TaxID=1932789 RepID=UPI002C9E8F79|nr:GGDEF domain-containing protein [Jatrophihabitans sp.]